MPCNIEAVILAGMRAIVDWRDEARDNTMLKATVVVALDVEQALLRIVEGLRQRYVTASCPEMESVCSHHKPLNMHVGPSGY